MARKFDVSGVVSPTNARLRGDSLTHINNSFDELTNAVVKGILSSYTTGHLIILNGCVVSQYLAPGATTDMTAGQIFYNGRIYEVDAVTNLSITVANTAVFTLASSLQGGQTTFTDANLYDFQVIEKIALTNGASGSGLANYNDGAIVKEFIKRKVVSFGPWNMDSTSSFNVAHGISNAVTKIKGVQVVIVSNAGIPTTLWNRGFGAVDYWDATNVVLGRTDTGTQIAANDGFDGALYNAATGYLLIEYGDI